MTIFPKNNSLKFFKYYKFLSLIFFIFGCGSGSNNEPLLTQLIGRIIRKVEDKPTPVIIDIHLKGDTARRQASNRVGYYMKQGYEIKEL